MGLLLGSVVLAAGPGARTVRATAAAVLALPHLVGAASVGLLLSDSGVAGRWLGVGPDAWPALVAGPWPVATVVELAWKESAFVALVVVATLGRRAPGAGGDGDRAGRRRPPALDPRARAAGRSRRSAPPALIVFVYTVGSYEVAGCSAGPIPSRCPCWPTGCSARWTLDRPSAAPRPRSPPPWPSAWCVR